MEARYYLSIIQLCLSPFASFESLWLLACWQVTRIHYTDYTIIFCYSAFILVRVPLFNHQTNLIPWFIQFDLLFLQENCTIDIITHPKIEYLITKRKKKIWQIHMLNLDRETHMRSNDFVLLFIGLLETKVRSTQILFIIFTITTNNFVKEIYFS